MDSCPLYNFHYIDRNHLIFGMEIGPRENIYGQFWGLHYSFQGDKGLIVDSAFQIP